MKLCAHQPNYLPWVGFFNKINQADIFVVLDDVQFVRGSSTNSTNITQHNTKPLRLTVPTKKPHMTPIREVKINFGESALK